MINLSLGYNLCRILDPLALKQISKAFSALNKESSLVLKAAQKQTFNSLGSSKGKLLRCLDWIIRTGRINLIQRGYLRWKIQVFSICKSRVLLFTNKDKLACVRSLVAVPKLHIQRILIKYFYLWNLNIMQASNLLSLSNHENRMIGIRILRTFLSNSLRSYLTSWKAKPIKAPIHIRYSLHSLNRLFLRKMFRVFEKWKNPGFYYEEFYEETVTEKNITTKKFAVCRKPCTILEYYDYQSYDPAFRAVFRNLGHFLKRRMRESFKIWKSFLEKTQSRIDSITGLLTDRSVNFANLRMNSTKLRQLKLLLIGISTIHRQVCNMPARFLQAWAERAHIKELKETNFKFIVMNSQKKLQKKRMAMKNLKSLIMHEQPPNSNNKNK